MKPRTLHFAACFHRPKKRPFLDPGSCKVKSEAKIHTFFSREIWSIGIASINSLVETENLSPFQISWPRLPSRWRISGDKNVPTYVAIARDRKIPDSSLGDIISRRMSRLCPRDRERNILIGLYKNSLQPPGGRKTALDIFKLGKKVLKSDFYQFDV